MQDNKHFDLIAEAQNVLSPLRDILEDVEFERGEKNDWSINDDAISELMNKGLFYVTLKPDFFKAQKKLILDSYQYTDKKGNIVTIPERKYRGVGRHGKGKLTELIEKIFENRTFHEFANRLPKGRWTIDIGFLNPEEIHTSPDGKSTINVGALLLCLFASGYDPLHILRDQSKIKQWREEMGSIIVDETNRLLKGERQDVRRKLESLGKKIANEVAYYIESGIKPSLDKDTITKRRSLKKSHPSLYPNGIEEPLSETEQLESFVWFRVNGENAWREYYQEFEKRRKEDKADAKKVAAKVEKKWKEYKEPSEKDAKKKKSKNRVSGLSVRESSDELEKMALIQRRNSIDRTATGEIVNRGVNVHDTRQYELQRSSLIKMSKDIESFKQRIGTSLSVEEIREGSIFDSLSWSDRQLVSSFISAKNILIIHGRRIGKIL